MYAARIAIHVDQDVISCRGRAGADSPGLTGRVAVPFSPIAGRMWRAVVLRRRKKTDRSLVKMVRGGSLAHGVDLCSLDEDMAVRTEMGGELSPSLNASRACLHTERGIIIIREEARIRHPARAVKEGHKGSSDWLIAAVKGPDGSRKPDSSADQAPKIT